MRSFFSQCCWGSLRCCIVTVHHFMCATMFMARKICTRTLILRFQFCTGIFLFNASPLHVQHVSALSVVFQTILSQNKMSSAKQVDYHLIIIILLFFTRGNHWWLKNYKSILIIIIINDTQLDHSDTVTNNITGALYTVTGKDHKTKRSAAGYSQCYAVVSSESHV